VLKRGVVDIRMLCMYTALFFCSKMRHMILRAVYHLTVMSKELLGNCICYEDTYLL